MSEAWITFLGTAGGAPTPDKGLPSILLHYQGTYVLLDVGECAQIKMMRAGIGPGRLDVILITHLHGDHVFGLPGLLQTIAMSSSNRTILLMGPRNTRRFLEETLSIAGSADPVVKIIEPPAEIGLNSLIIKPFRTCHGNIESYGYLITGVKKKGGETKARFRLAYTGDTAPCSEYLDLIRRVDILVHDATFDDEREEEAHLFGHSTIKDAALIARKSDAKVLFLFHTSTRYRGKEDRLLSKARRVFPNSFLAVEGMTFYF